MRKGSLQIARRQKGFSRLILIIIIVVVILIGGGAAAGLLLFMGGDEGDEYSTDPIATTNDGGGDAGDAGADGAPAGGFDNAQRTAKFWTIEPPLVVNYDKFGKAGFLQVTISVMTHDPNVLTKINTYSPAIRTHMILLFNGRKYEDLIGAENQIKLQELALEEVNRILTEFTGSGGAEAVYFTGYIMQ